MSNRPDVDEVLRVAERMITTAGRMITHDLLAFPACLRNVRTQVRQLRCARKIIRSYIKCESNIIHDDIQDACNVRMPDYDTDPDSAKWITWRCLNSIHNMIDLASW